MNDFAMDNGEVYSDVVADPIPSYEFTNDTNSGLYAATSTITITTSSGTSGDVYIHYTDVDPIEEMKSVVSKLAEDFLEKHC